VIYLMVMAIQMREVGISREAALCPDIRPANDVLEGLSVVHC